MSFEYFPALLAAVDDDAGLKIELNRTFFDETTIRLNLTDLASGRVWSFPIVSVEEDVTYETPRGPNTSRLPVETRLSRARMVEIVNELVAARRGGARALTPGEAMSAIEQGLFVYLSDGGAMLKFVPQFKVVWE